MLSNMIARADVRDPVQKQALETYLLDPKRTAEELRGFASVFPNANVAISQNLPHHRRSRELTLPRVTSLAIKCWLAGWRMTASNL